jgi:membrane protein YqaA with SNARE-associated domain
VLLAAALIAALFVGARISGVTELNARGVFALFTAAVLTITCVSIFTLGASFNYIVALFHKRPIRQGVFGKPLFKRPLERHFGWFGLVTMLAAGLIGLGSLVLGVNGWPQARLWFWELLSATGLLVGLQLIISWFMMRALADLNQRELRVTIDLAGREVMGEAIADLANETNLTNLGPA